MAKKQHKNQTVRKQQTDDSKLTVSDALDESILAQLKNAKNELTKEKQAQEEEMQEQKIRERKEREKNKSFAELLDEYGDEGTKY